MIEDIVLNAELAKPSIPRLLTRTSEHSRRSHNQHPDHQHRINRGPTCMRVVRVRLPRAPNSGPECRQFAEPNNLAAPLYRDQTNKVPTRKLLPVTPPRRRSLKKYSERLVGALSLAIRLWLAPRPRLRRLLA